MTSALTKQWPPENRTGLVITVDECRMIGRVRPAGHASVSDAKPSRRSVASPVEQRPGKLVPGTPDRPLT